MGCNKKMVLFFAVFFMLSAMGPGVWYQSLVKWVSVGMAIAGEKDSEKGKEVKKSDASDKDPAGKSGDKQAGDEGDTKKEGAPCPECPKCPDPAKVVLRGLEDKKKFIEASQRQLDEEKKELERYAEQVDEKLVALETLKKQIKADLAALERKKSQKEQEKETAYEAKISRLVKMYAGMKPKKAALIVDKMTLEVAQEIFLRMRESSAAQILAFVAAEKAAKISERLAFKKK